MAIPFCVTSPVITDHGIAAASPTQRNSAIDRQAEGAHEENKRKSDNTLTNQLFRHDI
jgi:hypothetical protein